MATKSKKDEAVDWRQVKTPQRESRGIGAWLLFFLGLNLFLVTSVWCIYTALSVGSANNLQTVMTDNDVKQQPAFKEKVVEYFDLATGAAVGDTSKLYYNSDWGNDYYSINIDDVSSNGGIEAQGAAVVQEAVDAEPVVKGSLEQEYLRILDKIFAEEGVNLEYYVQGVAGTVATNTAHQLLNDSGQVILPTGYDYYLAFDGRELTGYYEKAGYFDLQDNGYDELEGLAFVKQYQEGGNYRTRYPELAQCRIVLAVKADLEENYYGESALYRIKDQIMLQRYGFIIGLALWGVSVIMLVFSVLLRKSKRCFDCKLIEYSARIWAEFKVVMLIVAAVGVIAVVGSIVSAQFWTYWDWWETGGYILTYMCLGLPCFWVLYVLLLDLGVHKRDFFRHNIVNSYLSIIRSKEALQPFQERLLKRFYALIGTELALLLVTLITFWSILIPIFTISFGVFILVRYIRQYKELIEDIGKIGDQIERIKGGDMDTPLYLSPQADLYPVAQNLNSVQEGVVTATEQKMKSERMKIDLVTNVSHDLKTPLTSIISYTDLLSREEGLSESAKDYIRILRQKSDRLKALINDLFDLSKATSANLDVTLERIDFGKLLNQVTAELAEEIEQSQLTFKVSIPQEPIPIFSDGAKMHRVFDNLLLNALKYSLEGSRVYIDLTVEDGLATAVVKNTAKYEMDFDAETVIGRFVRGDTARSTEGSGLGLAIAQSYTEACGGIFEVTIDGDLFKVTITFDTEAASKMADKTPDEEPECAQSSDAVEQEQEEPAGVILQK